MQACLLDINAAVDDRGGILNLEDVEDECSPPAPNECGRAG